jgi:transposase
MTEVSRKGQSDSNSPKNPEVPEKPVRRRFDAKYKLRILELADREGLYSSHLTTWRRQREEGTLAALQPKRRGRKAPSQAPLVQENERLRRENERLTERLRQAETIIDVQKKISEMLGRPPQNPHDLEKT